MPAKRAHAYISGRVQGVSFRYYTVRQANKCGVNGWVKNLADGRVEAIFEGPEEQVQQMVEWCQQGPPAARVEQVQVEWSPAQDAWSDFNVRY